MSTISDKILKAQLVKKYNQDIIKYQKLLDQAKARARMLK